MVGGALIVTQLVSTAPDRAPVVSPEAPATSNSLAATRAQNSPMVAVDPADDRFVALANRIDAPVFGCSLQISGDSGASWIGAEPVPELPAGAEKCYSPEIVFDRDGRLYYLFVGLAGPGNSPTGVYLTTSDDRARSFSTPRRLLGPGNYQVRLAIDRDRGSRGRLYLVWLQTAVPPPTGGLPPTDNPIVAAYSDDGGETLSEPVRVSDPERPRVVGPSAVVAPDGTLHVSYFDLADDIRDYQGLPGPPFEGEWAILATSSTDRGRTFGSSVVVDDEVRPRDRVILIFTMPPPALGVSHDGRLHVAWEDAREGDSDVLLRSSSDGGRTWAGPLRLNDDPAGNGATQYLPHLGVAPDGRVDVIFYDRRRDPDDLFNDTYYTYSTDGGHSFAANVRLTDEGGTSRSGQRYLIPSSRKRNDIGSRLAVSSGDDRTIAAWADTRNAAISPYQDVFTAVIDHDEGASTLLASTGTGLVLAGIAGAGLVIRFRRRRTSSADQVEP